MPFTFNPFTGALDVVNDASSNVTGPASSTDNAVTRYDGTTGKLVQNSSVSIDDTGKMTLGADGTATLDAVTKQQLDAVAAAITSLDWQDAVIDKDLTAPPVSPSTGDRYLIGLDTAASVATGAWAGQDGNIATWNGSAWEFYTPVTGAFVGANDEQTVLYNFGGVTWTARSFEATTASGFLSKTGFDIQLTNLTNQSLIIGSAGNVATSVDTTSTGDITANTATGLTYKLGSIDNADINAAAAIDASKIADGSVSSTEFQQLDGVASPVVGESDTNTLTNKTIDADNNTISNLAHGAEVDNPTSGVHGVTGSVVGTTDAQTLTSKTIDADNNTISNLAHGAEVDNPTSGVHGVTGNVVGTTDTQTLSAKTLTSPVLDGTLSGTAFLDEDDMASNSAIAAASQQSIKAYTDTQDTKIAAIRYINENFESGVSSLVAYADAAGTSPVDGTGGSPTTAVSVETTNNLVGDQSAKIAKDAANRQGEGAAIISSTVDDAYSDKVHTVEFLWKTDGNYADGDIALFVVHPTTGTVEALNFRTALGEYTNELPASSATTTRIVSELTPIDSTYRIVLHVASTSATAYDVYVDNIQTGPQRTFNAPIVTEWESFTPTGSWTTNTTYSGNYRRVGDTAEIDYFLELSGAPNSAVLTFDMPNGLTIDTQKLAGLTDFEQSESLGVGVIRDSSASRYPGFLTYDGNDSFIVRYYGVSGSSSFTGTLNETALFTFASGDTVQMRVSVPITNWDAGAAFSSTSVDQRSAYLIAANNAGESLTANVTDIPFISVEDPFSSWDGSKFTAPVAGRYTLMGHIRTTVAHANTLFVYVNGTQVRTVGSGSNGASLIKEFQGFVDVEKGDEISIRTDGNYTLFAAANAHWISINYNPDFTVFGTFPEKNLVQTKILSANVTTDTTVSNLTCSNLVIGKWYEVTGRFTMQLDNSGSDGQLDVQVNHNGNIVEYIRYQVNETTDTSVDQANLSLVYKFKAEATSLTFSTNSASANSILLGNGTTNQTYVQIEERNDIRETDKF